MLVGQCLPLPFARLTSCGSIAVPTDCAKKSTPKQYRVSILGVSTRIADKENVMRIDMRSLKEDRLF